MQRKREDSQLGLAEQRAKVPQGAFSKPYSRANNLSLGALDPAQAASPRSGRIEEVLMQRHRQSQSKLTQLKARVQAEEMKEVRAAPEINATSRRLADAGYRPPGSAPRLKGAEKTRQVEKPSAISVAALSYTRSEAVLPPPPPLELRCLVSLKNGATSPVFPAVRAGQDEEPRLITTQGVSIDGLCTEVLEKYCEAPRIEPPGDLLGMAVLDRQDFFISHKKQKLALQRQLREDEEVRDCTFRPALTPRRSLSTSRSERSLVGSSRSVSATRQRAGYYERYMYTKALREASLNQTPNISSQKPIDPEPPRRIPARNPRPLYQALSPTNMRVGFRSGLNLSEFMSHAKPMISYRNVEVEKVQKQVKTASRSRR